MCFSFGITPTMEKLYHSGVMRTKIDDCQFVCIAQSDYYNILHQVGLLTTLVIALSYNIHLSFFGWGYLFIIAFFIRGTRSFLSCASGATTPGQLWKQSWNRLRTQVVGQESTCSNGKGKGSFYIAQYPVRWTAQSALHFLPSLTDLFIPTPTRLLREAF